MEADNIALFELERSNQIRYLMENASVREKKAMNILGASAKCEGFFVEKELMRSIANETNNVGKQDWSAVCRSHFPLCSEKNTSRFLSAFVAAGGASVQNSSISSAIRLENTTYERRMNSRTKLLSSARKALELYKRRILNFISYVWNGTCAVKANVERDYLKLKGLKRQLHQAREEINVLSSGASMQKVVEGKGTTLVKFEKGGREGFLVLQGKSVLKSPALPEQAVNGNVSTRVSALLEQAEHFDGSGACGAGCAVWTGSKADLTAEQLVANLTGEIDVHDVLLEVHVNILRRVARGERLLASLRDAKKKLEAEIEEAREGEQCEPVWRQLLRLVRG
ncbi:hypothetical protein ERJ75_000478300 [Trypanosoma vivax]|nr:hypothetical protein ERJ75_000478300 [Trypanosoma vivax]